MKDSMMQCICMGVAVSVGAGIQIGWGMGAGVLLGFIVGHMHSKE